MAAITGAQTNAVLVLGAISDNWATAKAAGAGDKIRSTISTSFDAQQLTPTPIGGGANFTAESIKGRETPVVNLGMEANYRMGADKLAGQFFGYSTVPAEQTPAQADYLHRFLLDTTANQVYLTLAYESTSSTVIELPTCTVRSFNTSFDETHNFLQLEAELLGNTVELSTAVNTNVVINAATIVDDDYVIAKTSDSFWINAESDGALDSGDLVEIQSYSRTLSRPQDFAGTLRGATGNSEPIPSNVPLGEVVVTMPSLANHDWYTAWKNGTKYKSKAFFTGDQIGSGTSKVWAEYCPSMKIVSAPDYQLTEAGFNTVTLTFTLLAAASAPTGMNSVYPYLEIINGRSTRYVA